MNPWAAYFLGIATVFFMYAIYMLVDNWLYTRDIHEEWEKRHWSNHE